MNPVEIAVRFILQPVQILVLIIAGILALAWLYVAARVVTRAVLRTLNEHKRRHQHGEEKTQASQPGEGQRER